MLIQEEGLIEIHALMESEDSAAEAQLRTLLEQLSVSCGKYVTITKANANAPGSGKTKLDKERQKLCLREIVSKINIRNDLFTRVFGVFQENLATSFRNLKALVTRNSLKERYKSAQSHLEKLKFLAEDVSLNRFTRELSLNDFHIFQPQESLPDIFLWIVSGEKRIAYQRIPARNVMYSMIDEECGRDCAKVQTLFLKVSYTYPNTFQQFRLMDCFSYLERKEWVLEVGRSNQNFKFICGLEFSNTKKNFVWVYRKVLKCHMK